MRPMRTLPDPGVDTAFFWSAGASGQLQFLQCSECGYYIHPPTPACPKCRSRSTSPQPVSGNATVVSYTVNHHPWRDDFPVPYAIAVVEMAEQAGLRLTTNIVGCEPDDVCIGMLVTVMFEQQDDVFLPLFVPATPLPDNPT
jgi:uncharacterized OB-fold protein